MKALIPDDHEFHMGSSAKLGCQATRERLP
jgi:hypothetical protein